MSIASSAVFIKQHIKSSSYAKMKSLYANNKGTDQTALPSTQPGQNICHLFSVKYICISFIQSNFNVRPSHMFSLRDPYIFFLVVMLKFKSQSHKFQKKS